ncbi:MULTISPECIES: acyl-CoA dehydrogenase family protein [Pseudonocardia]|uniref:Acyl-CoA dehydrogenase n=2 Tax=Pseudonocardia TaxID=1847 RepID=A0A1Y2MPK5_PSEAH|nr:MULTISPECIES: acyl-CoA dehydrogenase family protein [Pseudonocardia]OSY37081.1 Acyl-CoA dehydrogenase [Pseudonocardia autotrophica]TDN72053.1 alkylation response protein AidB-like acyl-CoA dehydrogenase [Pseudonocardia autotrophica]BBG02751.1 acyl-CoA dehydrogenase [Pseudonocardia autotrophica]GEC25916.1 acyl-CoA dehydrogenase [Pseudonocardia saturnea]
MRFSPEQAGFAAEVRAFCDRECGSAAQRDALTAGGTETNSPELLRRLAAQGWLGISLPEADGGLGGTFVDECLFLEETTRGLAPISGYSTGLTAAQTYLLVGTPEQRRTIVGNLVAGGIEAIALSEPGAGSDLASARLRARRDGSDWVLDGQKTWTSVAHLADHLLVLARTDSSGRRQEGLTLFMVPTSTPGLEIRGIDTMEGHVVNDVFLTDLRLPAEAVVGTEGAAWEHLNRGLGVERVIIAAMGVGAAQRSLDDVLAYTAEREQFGRAIGSFQAVRHRLADLATEIEHCRAFVYDVADRIDAGEEGDLGTRSSMAKIKSTETAKQASLEAMQLMGGYGYAREYGMESQVRRALAPPIYGGTNEIQREIISRGLRAPAKERT